MQKSAGTLTGKLDGTNSTLMQALTDTRKNLADYQNALKDFQTTVKDSGSLIDDTLKTLDSVNAVASSGSAALADSSDLLATSRTAIGTFSTEFSTSLSDGETLLNNVYTSAVLKLGTFETKATQVNTAIGDSISSASSLNKKNAEILEKLAALQQQIGSDSSLSGIVSEKIAELQAQNDSLQELIDSLGNSNSSIGNALTTASNTRSSLETLTAQNRQSLQNYRSSLNQSLLPQLNQSLDGLATLSGNLSSTLTGVNPTITQLKVILTQLKSSLNESADALGQTGGTLESVDTALENITADLKALQSSETYQHLISLEGIDSDSISDFMSSPVSINSKVLYNVENYGSGMTPFYTNLALCWRTDPGIHPETGSRQRRNHFPFYSDNCLFRTLDALCRGRTDPGIYCVHRRSAASESTVCPPGCICVRWYALLLCVCQSDLCNGADLQAHWKSACRCPGHPADPWFFRNLSDRDDTGLFPETASASAVLLRNWRYA